VVCFYLGAFVLSKCPRLTLFWTALLTGFAIVLATGWEQRFGGLEATRKFFYEQIYPTLKEVSPEYLKKLASDRIFSTLFYPNTLAGGILLLLPSALVVVWAFGGHGRMTPAARSTLTGLFAAAALACLYWSGSKGGWLLMLLLGLIALLRLPFRRSLKVALVVVVLASGLTGFVWKYSGYLKKGATSIVARFDYWRAAVITAREHPWLGTGPGTFAIPYERIKRPASEMARLTHNDYLEQASDSGIAGAALYVLFVCSAVVILGTRMLARPVNPAETDSPAQPNPPALPPKRGGARSKAVRSVFDPPDQEKFQNTGIQSFAMWLGLLSWALHGTFDFGLYVPGLAWIAFAFCGFLLAKTSSPAR
jgi:O-antigen ligase